MSENILEIHNLTKRFGTFTAVGEVSFDVKKGKIVGLLGPNGAGKTTLLSMLVGLFPPSGGTIVIDDEELPRMSTAMKHTFGFVPDSQEMLSHLTGWEYLQFLRRVYQLSEKEWEIAREYLALLHMESKAQHLLETYSHGQCKKIQLIAALLHQPPLLILDEPFSGLDPEMIALVKRLLRRLCERETGILLSTHDLLMAEGLCDTVVFLNQSRVVNTGSPAHLLSLYETTHLEDAFLKALGLEQQEEELNRVLADF